MLHLQLHTITIVNAECGMAG